MRSGAHNRSGQYMVEFSVTFVVFFFFITACISIILWGYNYNILQGAAFKASRDFAIGNVQDVPLITNWEAGNRKVGYSIDAIKQQLLADLGGKLIPLPLFVFSVDSIDFALCRQRDMEPNSDATWAMYTDGNFARITINYKWGISLGFLGELTSTTPIVTDMVIVRDNDEDWDSSDDGFEGQWADDHDNDGTDDGDTEGAYDLDDDGDGIEDWVDTGMLVRGPEGTIWLYADTWTTGGVDTTTLRTLYGDDRYHDPEWIAINTTAPVILFPRQVPRALHDDSATIRISMKYDKDNDGWMDCFDRAPSDPGVH